VHQVGQLPKNNSVMHGQQNVEQKKANRMFVYMLFSVQWGM